MRGIRTRLMNKVCKAQMNLTDYGMWFLLAIGILMIALLYYAFTKSV